MKPAARLQAAIEIVDLVIASTKRGGAAADSIVAAYFKERRYAGSGDRRAIRDLVYAAIRRARISPQSGRAALLGLAEDQPELRELFDGSHYGPAVVEDDEIAADRFPVPDWLRPALSQQVREADLEALAERAPLDIRVSLKRIGRAAVLSELGGDATAGRHSPSAIRLPTGFPIERQRLWQDGLIDVQDEGSQIIADACGVEAGQTVVDLCAGAGGKSFALYDHMCGKGRLIACDIDRRRLSRLEPRADRMAMRDIEIRLLDGGDEASALSDLSSAADCVLVDAPCSGTGTWRRNPEAAWRLSPREIHRYAAMQRRILDIGAELVAPGGILVYAVCSLVAEEGEAVIAAFLDNRSEFRKDAPDSAVGHVSGRGYLLSPSVHGTDGFFFARLRRT